MEGLATIDPNFRTGEARLLPVLPIRQWQTGCCSEDPARGREGEVTADTPANPDRLACPQGDVASLGITRHHIACGHAQHTRPHRRLSPPTASVQPGGELSTPLHRARVGGAEHLQQIQKLGPGLGVVLDHLEQGAKTFLNAVISGTGDPRC